MRETGSPHDALWRLESYEERLIQTQNRGTQFDLYRVYCEYAELIGSSAPVEPNSNDPFGGLRGAIAIYERALKNCGSNPRYAQNIHEASGKKWKLLGMVTALLDVEDGDFSRLYANNERFSLKHGDIKAYEASIQHYSRALELARTTGNGFGRTYAGLHGEIAESFVLLRNWDQAADHFENALGHYDKAVHSGSLDRNQQIELLERFSQVLENGPLALAKAKGAIAGLNFADRATGRLLLDALSFRKERMTSQQMLQLNALKAEAAELEAKLARAGVPEKRAILMRISELRGEISSFRERAPANHSIALTEFPSLMPPRAVLISPILSKYQGAIISARTDGTEVVISSSDVPDWFAIDEVFQAYFDGLNQLKSSIEIGDVLHAADDLDQVIAKTDQALRPLIHKLSANKLEGSSTRLVLAHCAKLSSLPLAAFSEGKDRMIDAFEFSILPSIAIGRSLIKGAQDKAGHSVAVLGRSEAGLKRDASNYIYSDIDADFVAGIVSGDTAPGAPPPLSNDRSAFLSHLSSKSIWHFAGHGQFNREQPLSSSLDISETDKIYLRDFVDAEYLDPAKLVMITSCESGYSDTAKLENEFIGWPAAFLQMGVQGVVATLWPVASLPTSILVCKFYDLFITDEDMAPSALRKAQLWMRDSTVEDLIADIERWKGRGLMPNQHASRLMADLQAMGLSLDERAFPESYFWAGFAFHGLPNLRYRDG